MAYNVTNNKNNIYLNNKYIYRANQFDVNWEWSETTFTPI